MLKTIGVQGFKSIERQTIELGSINVLIGANGSGKSNLLDALSFFHPGPPDALVKRLGGAARLLFHGKRTTRECAFEFVEDSFRYKRVLIPAAGDRLIEDEIYYNKCIVNDKSSENGENIAPDGGLNREGGYFSAVEFISNWRKYHLHDTSVMAAIKSACNIDDNRFLRGDASNLAAFLYWLKFKEPVSYQRIVSIVQIAMPYFEDFTMEPLRHDKRTIRLEWKQRNSDACFDADGLSDGSLRFICLTTLLNQPVWAMPSLMVIDEPELGLHPLTIRLLTEMLEAASEETQIILATQSVTLIDNFPIDVMIVTDYDGRASRFRRLCFDDYAVWLENFSVGQLWEKNVLGGRP